MKTYTNLWEKLVSFKNLYIAYKKARKAKPSSGEVYRYQLNFEKNIFKLQEELISGTYKISDYRSFTIFEPKRRIIKALPFKDRIVQHALCNLIEPIFEKTFIFNSFACRKEKGTHKGLEIIKKGIKGKFRKEGYALKCDVKKYFPTIDHEILKKLLFKKIRDKKVCNLMSLIIDSDISEFGVNKGIPIGNLTSQLFANIYLNELDMFVKHKLKIKYYYRYVDDFLIFSNSKKELQNYKKKILHFLKSKLKLEVPKRKTNIYFIKDGVDFVGYKVFPKFTRLRKSNLIKFQKRTIYLFRLLIHKKIKMDEKSFDVVIEIDNETKQYYASVPVLPGCYTYAETLTELLTNIKEAIELHLETVSETPNFQINKVLGLVKVTV